MDGVAVTLGSGHSVRVVVIPLGSGFNADEVRSGSRCNRQQVGVTTVRVSSSRQGALWGYGLGYESPPGGAQDTQKALRPKVT